MYSHLNLDSFLCLRKRTLNSEPRRLWLIEIDEVGWAGWVTGLGWAGLGLAWLGWASAFPRYGSSRSTKNIEVKYDELAIATSHRQISHW